VNVPCRDTPADRDAKVQLRASMPAFSHEANLDTSFSTLSGDGTLAGHGAACYTAAIAVKDAGRAIRWKM
jgi:hypothetical protein